MCVKWEIERENQVRGNSKKMIRRNKESQTRGFRWQEKREKEERFEC